MSQVIKTGDIVVGCVSGIQPYGAFVNLDNGITGLVHISEISSGYVRNIEDYMHVNDKLSFYVIEYDSENKKAKLSLKRLDNKGNRKRTYTYRKKDVLNDNLIYFNDVIDLVNKEVEKEERKQMIKVDIKNILKPIDFNKYQSKVDEIDSLIKSRKGLGGDYLGFVNYPSNFNDKELYYINEVAKDIRSKYDTFVVCGIGGSYLGARAGIEMVNGLYSKDKMKIIFMGNTFSSEYTKRMLEYLEDKNFAIDVISKSGGTLETAIGFRLLKDLMNRKYGEDEARKRIYVTTDEKNGKLRELANKEGYVSFVVPNDIQGRYSVITPVGLLPLAVAGVDIYELMNGARKAEQELDNHDVLKNSAYQYALTRRLLGEDKSVELLVTYDPQMVEFAEWWKQLFGESEGKESKGLLPMSVNYSTDLHSLGQFVQDGSKILFETTILFDKTTDLIIPKANDGQDALKPVEGRNLAEVNKIVCEATVSAHTQGQVPNIIIHYPSIDAFGFGYLVYFFMYSIVISSYLLNVNPCNQEAVEVYKKKMKELLCK